MLNVALLLLVGALGLINLNFKWVDKQKNWVVWTLATLRVICLTVGVLGVYNLVGLIMMVNEFGLSILALL